MGGKVSKSPNGWCVGVHEFEIKKAAKWMQPFQNNINLLMMCQDQVLELPEGAKVLAGNQTCPAGVFQVGEKMLGIQAHPEYSKAYNQLLMEMRIDRMGKTVVNDGIARLEKEVHQNIIRSWILNFIQFNAQRSSQNSSLFTFPIAETLSVIYLMKDYDVTKEGSTVFIKKAFT